MKKHVKVDPKICNWCGKPFYTESCKNHKVSFNGNRVDLPSYGQIKPVKTMYVKRIYRNWSERMSSYREFVYPEIDSSVKRIVDLGCGTNQLSKMIKEDFPHVEAQGFDMYKRDVDVQVIDFEHEKLPFNDGTVDFIVLSHVLEHLENIHFVIEECFRVGNKIVIALPNPLDIFTITKAAFGKDIGSLMGLPLTKPQDRHKWFFTHSDALQLIGWNAFRFNRQYRVINFVHPRVPRWLAPVNPNLFCGEMLFIISK